MKSVLLFSILPFFSLPLLAGTAQPDGKSDGKSVPAASPRTEVYFKVASDYVFSSDFKDGNLGDQDALHAFVQLGIAVPITNAIYFTVGGFYDRFDFGTSLAPVPTTLHQLGLDIGLQYRVDGQTAVALQASPGIYSSEINSDGFNVPFLAYGSYRLSSNFIVVGGARYNAWSEYEILPLVGFIWTINDKVKVNALLPTPNVEFAVCPETTITVGGELVGGTYKTARSEQNHPGEHLDYTDVRAGAGIRYTGFKPFDLQLKAGWSFERQFRYDNADKEFKTEGAPYVSVSAGATF